MLHRSVIRFPMLLSGLLVLALVAPEVGGAPAKRSERKEARNEESGQKAAAGRREGRKLQRIGVLRCDISEGLVLASSRSMECRFQPRGGGGQLYAGRIERVRLDIGENSRPAMVWAVLAPDDLTRGRILAGTYVEADGDVTASIRGSRTLLVGAGNPPMTLQPLSLRPSAGTNFAPGVSRLTLK